MPLPPLSAFRERKAKMESIVRVVSFLVLLGCVVLWLRFDEERPG